MKTARETPMAAARKRARAVLASTRQSKPLVAAETKSNAPAPAATGSRWTFLTNHSHVLVHLSRNPSLVLREVAVQVGITERAVQRIIADLESGGVIEREKVGRQNHYRILTDQPLRHGIVESRLTIGELLSLINGA